MEQVKVETAKATIHIEEHPEVEVIDVNEAEIVHLLMGAEARGTSIVSFTCLTDPRLKKTGLPIGYKGVVKASQVNGMIGYDYENSVNNRRKKEQGDDAEKFVTQGRAWGTRLNRVFVVNKGGLYVTIKIERTLAKPRFYDAKGEEVTKEEIAAWLPAPRKAKTQGVEQEIIHREYKLLSIQEIRMGGNVYRIKH